MLTEGQQLSHYRIVSLLKSGGMGEVYHAVDTHLNRQVAIKVINTDALRYAEVEAAKDAARLFLREARAIAQLDQTNILPLYDSGEQIVDGISLMFMVMPYRHAGSLADWKRSHFGDHPLPLAAVECIVEQAALALQHAHDRQIIHQDVKPSNFLIQGNADHPGELHLQLADFGVAKAMMVSSESQIIRGTPTYMAPEQWEGHPVPATDQYALAVMAYELLTGRPPFIGNGYQHMWHQHVHVTPGLPSHINPSLPKGLDAVFLRALDKKPERRYSSVLAFAHAFQRAVIDGGNIFQALTISALEARTGTNRVVSVPNGRNVIVPIPPGVTDGQIIRLDGCGRPTTYSHPVGALIVTISISPVIVTETVPPTATTFQHTIPAISSLAPTEARHTLPPVPLMKRSTKNLPVLKICFVLVALAACIGLCYVSSSSALNGILQKNTPMETATPTLGALPAYLSKLYGSGKLAFSDSLAGNNQGNNWASTPTPSSTPSPTYGSCLYIENALHVRVYGDTGVTYHLCMPEKASTSSYATSYSNLAYQVKMRIISGDCGGVSFREQGVQLYYFFICQNNNYKCFKNSTKTCNYGLILYTQNPPSGNPDSKLNPPLTEGYSRTIADGANQQYTIAVVARGEKIDLFVNDQRIDGVYDNVYKQGEIGVLAKTFGKYTTEVSFSDAAVWKL